MPYNLSRQTFKNAQRSLEHCTILKDLTTAQKSASKNPASSDKTLHDLDNMISKMQGLKRKLEGLQEEEKKWNKASKARVQHLGELWEMESLVDVKYDEWSRTRLSRLLVDYLLRSGYTESAAHLAKSKNIEELVDVDAFVSAHKIESSLCEGKTVVLALNWCKENGQALKKLGVNLEFELRLQQFIELVRAGHERLRDAMSDSDDTGGGIAMGGARGGGEEKLVEARTHAKKYLLNGNGAPDLEVLGRAAGLLAYRPWDPVEPYAVRLFIPATLDLC
jgi:macrophage erythroblast attacher